MPSYGPPGKSSARCSKHKAQDDISYLERPCTSCGLRYRLASGKVLCAYCDPESKLPRESRELKVAKFLREAFPDAVYIHNRSIAGRYCPEVRSRPDFLFDRGTHIVVLEVDQHQHRYGNNYTEACEIGRMYNIVASLGLPVYFLRYNPDGFKMGTRKISLSPGRRHTVLKKLLTAAFNWDPAQAEMMKVMYLFYDREMLEESHMIEDSSFVVDVTKSVSQRLDELRKDGQIQTMSF